MAKLVLDEDSRLEAVILPDSYADQSYRTVVEVPDEKAAWAKRVSAEWDQVQEYLREVVDQHHAAQDAGKVRMEK